jgi:hypothetical protein
MMDCTDKFQFIFNHPATVMIGGPSKSGKTYLTLKMLKANQIIFNKPPTKIVYCYTRFQDKYKELDDVLPKIEFVQGLPEMEIFVPNENNLVILDDLMSECGEDLRIKNLFTIDSHHLNISVFYLCQNVFNNNKNSRTIRLNSDYMIILNNPKDRAQFQFLFRQLFPKSHKFLHECYEDAVESKKYGYLFLDLTQEIDNNYRVQSQFDFDDTNEIKRIIYKLK